MVLYGRLADELAEPMTNLFEQPAEVRVMTVPDVKAVRWANCFSGFELPEPLPVGHLEWVHCWGAGTEQWQTRGLPQNCLLTRTVGDMPIRMAEFCLTYSLALLGGIFEVRDNQADHCWRDVTGELLAGQRVAILGCGEIGSVIGRSYAANGAVVTGFSRTASAVRGLQILPVERLKKLGSEFDILINCLPLTPQTQGFSNQELLERMTLKQFINVGRSGTVVLADLLAALAAKSIQNLVLDVHDEEPLPTDSPLWATKGLWVSPHRSAPTMAIDVLSSIINIKELRDKSNLIVNMSQGY